MVPGGFSPVVLTSAASPEEAIMTTSAKTSQTAPTETSKTRKPDLASLYRPLGISAVIAAAALARPTHHAV